MFLSLGRKEAIHAGETIDVLEDANLTFCWKGQIRKGAWKVRA